MAAASHLLCTHSIDSGFVASETSFLSSSAAVWAQVAETRQWIYHKWAMQLPWEWPRDRNQYDTKRSAIDSHPWQSAPVPSHRKE